MKDSHYLDFDRQDWASLRGRTPLTLTPEEVDKLSGISVNLDIDMESVPRLCAEHGLTHPALEAQPA